MEGLTENQILTVQGHLQAVLGVDNQQRKLHEAELSTLRSAHPNELVCCLLHTLTQSQDASLRTLAAVLLRSMFSAMGRLKVWQDLTPEVRDLSKNTVLQAVNSEPVRPVKKRICDVIGELGSNLLSSDGEDWPELRNFLFQGTQSEDLSLRAYCFHILAGLFTFLHEQLSANQGLLIQIFTNSLSSTDLYVRLHCLEAVCSLLSVIDSKETLPYQSLLPSILQSVLFIAQSSEIDGKDAFDHLTELAESEPKFFKDHIQACLELVQHIFALTDVMDLSLKNMSLEFLIAIFERLTSSLKNDTQLAQNLINKIFEFMVSVDFEVSDSWAKPKEGFQEKDDESGDIEIDYVKLGCKMISRLMISIGDKYLLPIVMPIVQQAIAQTNDWRYKYTGLMVISEVGNNISEPEKIAELVPILVEHASSNYHAKIRYGAYRCIGQISEDFEYEFQSAHHAVIVPVLLQGLDDSIPRVQAHCCAAITNFFETAGETIANLYAATFIPKLTSMVVPTNISLVIEHALTSLAAISEACKEQFSQFYEQMMPFLFNIINSYNSNEYKKLKGRAIECMTLMCNAVGKNIFQSNAQQVIELIKSIQDNTNFEADDALRSYILSAWQRIAATLRQDFAPYLGNVLPGLLGMASANVVASTSANPESSIDIQSLMEDDKKKISVMTADIEDKEVGLQTILTIVDILKGSFAPYVEQTLGVAYPLIDYTVNESIRSSAASLLASLALSVKLSGVPDATQQTIYYSKMFLGKLWEQAEKEFDVETLVSQLEAIKSLIDAPETPFLTQEEVNASGEKSIKLLEESLKRRARNAKLDEIDSDDENETIKELNKKEEDSLHTSISEVIGSLFKTHTELSLGIVNFLYDNVLSKFLAPDTSVEDHKFAIFVIDDIIEFVGQQLVGEKWVALAEALVKYSNDSNDAVRQASVYGLGILASKSDPAVFASWTATVLNVLETAIQLPVAHSAKTHGHARDNAIAAIGRIIKYQSVNIDLNTVVFNWAKLLPLRYDKAEARQMHDILADICIEDPQLAYGSDMSNLPHIIWAFAEILETKTIDATTTAPKIKNIYLGLQGQNLPQLGEIWNQLSEVHRGKINKLLSSTFQNVLT